MKNFCFRGLLGLPLLLITIASTAQNVGINTSGNTAYPSAILDLSDQNTSGTLGFLPPYVDLNLPLTSFQLSGTAAQSNGIIIYATGAGTAPAGLYYWNNAGTKWIAMGGGPTGAGIVNYLARWGSATNLGTGVTQDNGIGVGIQSGVYAFPTGIELQVTGNATNPTAINGTTPMAAGYGVVGNNTAATGTGILGENTAAQGISTGYGVVGVTSQAGFLSAGVWGNNTNSVNGGIGVYGTANSSPGGIGVYGNSTVANGYGMWASNSGTGANGIGIYGSNSATGGSNQFAVSAYKLGNMASGNGFAIYALTNGTATTNYAGYFNAQGGATTNYGGYFAAAGATNNYSIIVPPGGGFAGFETAAPARAVEIGSLANTERIDGLMTGGTYNNLLGTKSDLVYADDANGDLHAIPPPSVASTLVSSAAGVLSWQNGVVPTGAGTVNYLARWTPNGATLGSGVTQDNGTRVSIQTGVSAFPSGNLLQVTANATDITAIAGISSVNNGIGVQGITTGAITGDYAVNAENSATGAGNQYGFYGVTSGSTGTGSGYGIYAASIGANFNNFGGYFSETGASNANYGVYGNANAAAGSAFGVYGVANGAAPFNYGGYFAAVGGTNNVGIQATPSALIGNPTSTQGSLILANATANSTTIQSSNSATTPYTMTLPTAPALAANYVLGSMGANATLQWINPAAAGGYILNQSTAAQTANYWITGPAANGANYVTNQQELVQTTNAVNIGVEGDNTAASGAALGIGMKGTTAQSAGYGVYGNNTSALNGGIGVYGTANGAAGIGVEGNSTTAGGYGVEGISTIATGTGAAVYGTTTNTTAGSSAVHGSNTTTTGTPAAVIGNIGNLINPTSPVAVYGSMNTSTTGVAVGGAVFGSGSAATAVYGYNSSTGPGTQYGVQGIAAGGGSSTTNIGGYFSAVGATNNFGIQATPEAVIGVPGTTLGTLLMANTTGNLIDIQSSNVSTASYDMVLPTAPAFAANYVLGSTGANATLQWINPSGPGGYILNQSTGAQNANYWITGPAANGAVYVTNQQELVQTTNAVNIGVEGDNTAASGPALGIGMKGTTAQSAGYGVYGNNTSALNGGIGVYGTANGAAGIGVEGNSTTAGGYGVKGISATTTLTGAGVLGTSTNITAGSAAIIGSNSANTGQAAGVIGNLGALTNPTFPTAVYGSVVAPNSGAYGVEGYLSGVGTSYGAAVYGNNSGTGANVQYGVQGSKLGNTGTGTGYGVYGMATGTATTNVGGYFTASGGTNNYGLVVPAGGGNTGLGIATPGVPLDVQNNQTVGIRYIKTGNGADARINIADNSGTQAAGWSWSVGWNTGGDFSLIEEGLSGDVIYFSHSTQFVGISCTNPQYTLDVNGNIRASGSVLYGGVACASAGTAYSKPDYVFQPDYKKTYSPIEIEKYIIANGHLPWVLSAADEKKENNGAVDMTRMSFQTLEAAENIQMQVIEQQKKMDEQNKIIAAQQATTVAQQASINEMKNEIELLKKQIAGMTANSNNAQQK